MRNIKLSVKFFIPFLLVFLFSLLSVSCTPKYYRDFDLVEKDYRFHPGTIVVLPGTLREQDMLLASKISEYLKKESTFRVTSYNQVKNSLPDYRNVMTDYTVPEGEKSRSQRYYLSKENIWNVKAINKKFKSKYVFLVWSGDLTMIRKTDNRGGSYGKDYKLKIYGRLIEFPNSKVVGYSLSEYSKNKNEGFLSFLNFTKWFKSDNEEVVDFLESCSEVIGLEIVRVSKLRKSKGGAI